MSTSSSTTSASLSALSAEELAGWVDRALDAADGMLFTATPREELAEIGRWQRLKDQAFAGQLRSIVAAYNRPTSQQRFFAGDEVGLAIGATSTTGGMLVMFACQVAELPGLLEAVEAGVLTERHLRAVMCELDKVELTLEQRQAVVLVLLARYDGEAPGELAKLVRRLILTVDRAAAKSRQDKATRGRQVRAYADVDGQGVIHARGPLEQIAAIKEHLRQQLTGLSWEEGDTRTSEQREYDLFVQLLTTGTVTGDEPMPGCGVQVIVPFHTAAGGELELAEIAGYGPTLPSTARDLLGRCQTITQVAVDEDGVVIGVGKPMPGPAARAESGRIDPTRTESTRTESTPSVDEALCAALTALRCPPPARPLSTDAYRPTESIRELVKARDRTCVFPGCHRRVTDLDHRFPWPLGPTSVLNLQLLCRHHHQAKQAVFTVELTPDGDYRWTTRGGWPFLRRRQGY